METEKREGAKAGLCPDPPGAEPLDLNPYASTHFPIFATNKAKS